ncbi:hypothetical protein D3C83_14160 [compost metagenome]
MRNCCAAPPFSTRSPSGRSDAPPGPFWLGSRKPQKLELVVQKLGELCDTNPVVVFSAGLPMGGGAECGGGSLAASARYTAPVAELSARLYIFRLPSQRGDLFWSGRNTPM